MPYAIRKNQDGSYKVVNKESGSVKAAHTSLDNARRQIRLLHGVKHGMRPRE
jgi:hypothetical protein